MKVLTLIIAGIVVAIAAAIMGLAAAMLPGSSEADTAIIYFFMLAFAFGVFLVVCGVYLAIRRRFQRGEVDTQRKESGPTRGSTEPRSSPPPGS